MTTKTTNSQAKLHVQDFLQGCGRPYIIRDEKGVYVAHTYSLKEANEIVSKASGKTEGENK